jgi:hypothetical protein
MYGDTKICVANVEATKPRIPNFSVIFPNLFSIGDESNKSPSVARNES